MPFQHKEDSHTHLDTARLEAFSDGVLAIIITITVLELKIPDGASLATLKPLLPMFFAYVFSFQTIGTYWNNHHLLLQIAKHVSPGIMWGNLNLLFWLSLIPFTTGWLGRNHGGSLPTALYAAVLLLCAVSYSILQHAALLHSENRAQLTAELNKSWKGPITLLCYASAVGLAFVNPIISDVLIVLVSVMWFIPDRRIAKHL